MNVKKEVEMWDVTQIFNYAMEFYSQYIGNTKDEKSYADKCRKYIRRTLSECSFTPRCDDKGCEKYAIPVIFAKEFVEYSYMIILQKSLRKKQKNIEKNWKNSMKKN